MCEHLEGWGRNIQARNARGQVLKRFCGFTKYPGFVTQGSCGCLIPGWGLEQPGLEEGVPAHGRGGGTGWALSSLQLKYSMIPFPNTCTCEAPNSWITCQWSFHFPGHLQASGAKGQKRRTENKAGERS